MNIQGINCDKCGSFDHINKYCPLPQKGLYYGVPNKKKTFELIKCGHCYHPCEISNISPYNYYFTCNNCRKQSMFYRTTLTKLLYFTTFIGAACLGVGFFSGMYVSQQYK